MQSQVKKVSGGGSPERQKMYSVMTVKGLAENTQQSYVQSVCMLTKHYNCAPHLLTADQVSDWVLERINQGLTPRTTNVDVAALRLFYGDVVDQPEKLAGLHGRRVADKLPRSFPQSSVEPLIHGINDRCYRAATMTAYGAGLRISEVVALQISDIRGEQGLIHIRAGKGGHERMAYLPGTVYEALRHFWKTTWPRPTSWLFYRNTPDQPISADGLRQAFNKGRDRAQLDRTITFHCLRHAVATHLLENGASASVVQDFLGHKSPESTRIYARTTGAMFRKIDHPVTRLSNAI